MFFEVQEDALDSLSFLLRSAYFFRPAGIPEMLYFRKRLLNFLLPDDPVDIF